MDSVLSKIMVFALFLRKDIQLNLFKKNKKFK